jgi:hypothetical protein
VQHPPRLLYWFHMSNKTRRVLIASLRDINHIQRIPAFIGEACGHAANRLERQAARIAELEKRLKKKKKAKGKK